VRPELLTLAARLAERREPFVLATVVRRVAASAAQAGDSALVTASGEFHGWLGGSCTQPIVVREALAALAEGEPRMIALSPNPEAESRPGVRVFPMTCHSGGTVDISLDPVRPARRLFVFGHSPIAQALARIAAAAGFAVEAADAQVGHGALPETVHVVTDPAALRPSADKSDAAVVASMGEDDETSIAEALRLSPSYVGVVASPKRFAQIRESLLSRGVSGADLDRIHGPAGLDIGARTPEEIAVSILAEVVAVSRAPGAAERRRQAAEPRPTPGLPSVAAEERDPVCGMTVALATARHRAEAGGRSYVFCCGGCREKFLAAPERYGAAAAGGAA
jgi:xanthine dehydrogenase accessory factor